MVFNSVVFLFGFLPLALLLYYLVPGRLKNAVLLLESLAFYCWTGVQYLPLIAFLVVFNYIWGVLEELLTRRRPLLLTISVLVNLAALVYFKYANFLIDSLNSLTQLGIARLDVGAVLPLGISYYIFKIISYQADICSEKIKAEKDPVIFAAYVLFFPQLIVGPIIKYRSCTTPVTAAPLRWHRPAASCLFSAWRKRSFWRIPSARCGAISSARAAWGWRRFPPRWRGWAFWRIPCSCIWTLRASAR